MTLNATKAQFDVENEFYRTVHPQRLGKLLAQYELFARTAGLPGAIVECGVFKGSSLYRLACFRALRSSDWATHIVAFDTFDTYVDEPGDTRDAALRKRVVDEAGHRCASREEIVVALAWRACNRNVELVKGYAETTIPEYVGQHPELRISLLNLDLDFYTGSQTALAFLWPLVVPGGIMLLDNYGVFAGETRAVDEFGLKPQRLPYSYSPSFVVKP